MWLEAAQPSGDNMTCPCREGLAGPTTCNMNLVFWTWCSGLLSDFIASLLACEETELRAWVTKVAFCSSGVFYKHDPTSHQPPTFPPTTGSVIRHPAMGLQCSGSTSAKGSVQGRCQQRSGWEWGGTVGTFKRAPARSRFSALPAH